MRYEVGLVLTADGRGLKGEVKLSREELKKLGIEAGKAERPVRNTGDALDRTGREARQAGQDFGRAESATRNLGGSFGSLKTAAAGIGLLLVAREAKQLVTGAVETERQFEKLERRIAFFTGSTKEMRRELAVAADIADRYAVAEAAVIDARAGLLPLEQANVISQKNALAVMTGLIDASKALAADQTQLKQVMFGLGQALSSSTVRAEEFNQVTEPLKSLPQAMNRAIAEMTDGTERNFRQMIVQGEVTNDLFANVLVRALQEFEGAGERSVDTLDGKFIELSNSWQRFERSITNSDLVKNGLDIVIRIVNAGTSLFEDEPLAPLADRIAEAEKRIDFLGRARAGLRSETAREDARRQLQASIDELAALRIELAADEAATEAATRKAEDDLRQKAEAAALSRIDAAPETTAQKAAAIREKIAAIRTDVEAGLVAAERAAPALEAYEKQLAKLLKAATGPDLTGRLTEGSSASVIAAQVAKIQTELELATARRGRIALEDFAGDFGGKLDLDLGGLVAFENIEASGEATRVLIDALADLRADLAGSDIRLDRMGLPADPALRATLLGNAVAIAELAGAEEQARLEIAAQADAEKARAEAARDAAEAHRRSAETIAESLTDLLSPYDKAVAAAKAWREEAVAGLDPKAAGYSGFLADAEKIYRAQLAEAREEQAGRERTALGRIGDALVALKSPYEQAVAAAKKWREETRAALEEAGVDAEAHAAKIEEVYAGRIARAERDRTERQEAALGTLSAALLQLQSPFEQATAAAEAWREDTREALEEAGLDAEAHAAKIEEVYAGRIARAEEDRAERQRRVVAGLDAALRSLEPSYSRSVAEAEEWATATREALAEAGLDASLYAERIDEVLGLRLARAYEDDLSRRRDWAAGVERGLKGLREETEDFASASETAIRDFSKAGEDAFVTMATGGKLAVRDLVDSVLEDFARLAYRKTIGAGIDSLLGKALGGLGSALTGSGAPTVTADDVPFIPVGEFHTGGVAGISGGASRRVRASAADILGAPRYHGGGVAGDEVLSVLKRGEPVFTPRQFDNMNGLIAGLAANAARPAAAPKIEVHTHTETPMRVEQRQTGNGGTRIDIFEQAEAKMAGRVRAKQGPLYDSIVSATNARPSFSGGSR